MVIRPAPAHSPDWDFYADPVAVADYVDYRDRGGSRNSLIEEPDFLSFVGSVDGLSCLDLGCGYGHYSELLARSAAAVTGVDRSELMISRAESAGAADGFRICAPI